MINDVSLTEGNSGTTNADFTVTLSAPSGRNVTVNYATANATATQPADYTTTSGTLTFTPGQVTKTVSVPVVGDTIDEIDETFVVNLTVPVNVTIADNQGVGTVTDDDPLPSITINDVSLTEATANMTFTVTLSGASGKTVTVDYATADGTATSPADYTSAAGTVSFAPGIITRTSPCPSWETPSTSSMRRCSPTSRIQRTQPSRTTRASGIHGQRSNPDADVR